MANPQRDPFIATLAAGAVIGMRLMLGLGIIFFGILSTQSTLPRWMPVAIAACGMFYCWSAALTWKRIAALSPFLDHDGENTEQ